MSSFTVLFTHAAQQPQPMYNLAKSKVGEGVLPPYHPVSSAATSMQKDFDSERIKTTIAPRMQIGMNEAKWRYEPFCLLLLLHTLSSLTVILFILLYNLKYCYA